MSGLQVTRFLHSRWLLIIIALVMVPTAMFVLDFVPIDYIEGDRGLIFPSANLWITDHTTEMWVNVLSTLTLAALMIGLNRNYNLLRTMTLLDASLFLLISLSTPWLLVQFYTGTLLSLALVLCLYMLYSCYSNPAQLRRIFLIFFLLSALSTTQYCYAVYIPVFIIGTLQMRIFSGRALAAILLGILAPWWIVLGSGLVAPESVHIPDFSTLILNFNFVENFPLFVVVLVSAILLVVCWCLNFPRMIAYNAHMRAFNGTLSVLALFTLVAVCIDFVNLSAYAPVVFMCAAFYTGRLFAANAGARSYIGILSIIVLYILLFLWSLT